jgi:hypothetical protein
MTTPATQGKSQAPLRTVKITAIPSGKKFADHDDSAATGPNPQGKTEIEEIVNRGLDLAETGIGLGVNIVARLGSIFKDQVFDKINPELLNSAINSAAARSDQAEQPQQSQEEHSQASQQNAGAEADYLINRLPLFPGDTASLSFSINNDSLTSEKRIRLAIEPFIGELHQYRIDGSAFSLTPSPIAIAPVDFEKFVLKGDLAEEVPADVYHGWIIVSEEQTYRIPVILVVSNRPDVSAEQSLQAAVESITQKIQTEEHG